MILPTVVVVFCPVRRTIGITIAAITTSIIPATTVFITNPRVHLQSKSVNSKIHQQVEKFTFSFHLLSRHY